MSTDIMFELPIWMRIIVLGVSYLIAYLFVFDDKEMKKVDFLKKLILASGAGRVFLTGICAFISWIMNL